MSKYKQLINFMSMDDRHTTLKNTKINKAMCEFVDLFTIIEDRYLKVVKPDNWVLTEEKKQVLENSLKNKLTHYLFDECERCVNLVEGEYIRVCRGCCGIKDSETVYPCVCVKKISTQQEKYDAKICKDCIKANKYYDLNINKTKYHTTPISERIILLQQAFGKYRVTPREDSILCKIFIWEGIIVMNSLDEIAKRMAEMKYLFEHTNYKEHLKTTNKNDAELLTLLEIGGFPEKFPWV